MVVLCCFAPLIRQFAHPLRIVPVNRFAGIAGIALCETGADRREVGGRRRAILPFLDAPDRIEPVVEVSNTYFAKSKGY